MARRSTRTATLSLLITYARDYKRAVEAGERASVSEELGEPVERSSDSWFEEADEAQRALFAMIDRLDAEERAR